MNILITGGAGFIGSHLADALIKLNHNVTIIDNLSSGTKFNVPSEAEFIEADIRTSSIANIFKNHKFDLVFHEAAQTLVPESIKNPYKDADENIMGLINVLESCRQTGVKKIIFSSSAAVYGNNSNLPLSENESLFPTSFYGLTKTTSEKYLNLYFEYFGIHYTILRYSNVYGPRQGANGEGGVIYIFAKALAENKPINIFGDGNQTRDFISVHDIVEANIAAITNGNEKILNISTETETTLNELANKMINLSKKDKNLIHYKKPRNGDIYRSCLSNKNAVAELNWKPKISLDKGLIETITYFKNKT
ncbi:NAD-dependent epimerase/dehydratase family protein [Dialister micraerophilus]|uniref:NAD-dependent epimerase/dehydratase family protein n=1 Tax=Dialister micraerophilus TaxID=309120 RepID=UPI0023F5908B|nr:NAD-dependent epimerase/dehydratase family protein [Dialister micraerophilus]